MDPRQELRIAAETELSAALKEHYKAIRIEELELVLNSLSPGLSLGTLRKAIEKRIDELKS